MLTVYKARDQKFMDEFVSNTMTKWGSQKDGACEWAFVQPDCGKAQYPLSFVIVIDEKIKMATIHTLN